MDAKKKRVEIEDDREEYREEQTDRMEFSELEVPDEMETWGLDDLSDLVPTTFD